MECPFAGRTTGLESCSSGRRRAAVVRRYPVTSSQVEWHTADLCGNCVVIVNYPEHVSVWSGNFAASTLHNSLQIGQTYSDIPDANVRPCHHSIGQDLLSPDFRFLPHSLQRSVEERPSYLSMDPGRCSHSDLGVFAFSPRSLQRYVEERPSWQSRGLGRCSTCFFAHCDRLSFEVYSFRFC